MGIRNDLPPPHWPLNQPPSHQTVSSVLAYLGIEQQHLNAYALECAQTGNIKRLLALLANDADCNTCDEAGNPIGVILFNKGYYAQVRQLSNHYPQVLQQKDGFENTVEFWLSRLKAA